MGRTRPIRLLPPSSLTRNHGIPPATPFDHGGSRQILTVALESKGGGEDFSFSFVVSCSLIAAIAKAIFNSWFRFTQPTQGFRFISFTRLPARSCVKTGVCVK